MPALPVPEHLVEERDQLIAEIYNAFAGVSREGGKSWRDAYVADMYGHPLKWYLDGLPDNDRHWDELVDDPSWPMTAGVGGYSFLDAIGFRYYIAPAMVRSVRGDYGDSISDFHFLLDDGKFREWHLEKWSLLNDRQSLCIQRFLQFMHSWERFINGDEDPFYEMFNPWKRALDSYWGDLSHRSQDIRRALYGTSFRPDA